MEALETDLGEFIIQIDHDHPSHIVRPIIHKNRREIATSFEREGLGAYDDDPAGRRWADANEAALATVGIKAVQVTWRAPKATEAPAPAPEADIDTMEQEWTAGEQPQKEGVVYPESLTDDDKAFIKWGDEHPWPSSTPTT
jgi:hypothetical protein